MHNTEDGEESQQPRVDHHVKIPPRKARTNTKYPFNVMNIGDSFEVDKMRGLSMAARYFGLTHNKRFIIRRQDDNTYRCWRIQ